MIFVTGHERAPHTHATTDLPGAPRRYGPAALAFALNAWRAGTDVQTALTQAGYAYEVVAGLTQYFRQASAPELEALSQSQSEEMSSKRARTSTSGEVQSAYARRKSPPVALSVKKYVKGCMDRLLEPKVYTKAVADVTPGTTGAVVATGCFDIVQGDTDSTREGNIIHIKKILSNLWIFDATAGGTMRVICFIDRQSNGSTPAVADVLNTATLTSLYSPNTVIGAGGSRFAILWDEAFTYNQQFSAATTVAGLKRKAVYKSIPVQFQANAGAAADVLTNQPWYIMISSNSSGTVRITTQLHFIDN